MKSLLPQKTDKKPVNYLVGGLLVVLMLTFFGSIGVIIRAAPELLARESRTTLIASNLVSTEVVRAQFTPEPQRRVGIQVGHWQVEDLPNELANLFWNRGASAGGHDEVDVNLNIAQKVETLLEAQGIAVDILPATVPANYAADAFVAIHADGNTDTGISGYKVAASQWDTDGQAELLSQSISSSYGLKTGMVQDSDMAVSENMVQYYAFNYGKYHATINAKTPGVIVEVGYITNAKDRKLITESDGKVAQGIADGILNFLEK